MPTTGTLAGRQRPGRASLPNLHLRVLQLRELPVFGFEAAMYLKQSDQPASLQLSSQRKRDLLDHFEDVY
jgi:hypothetical protein